MPRVPEQRPASFKAFVELIETLHTASGRLLWYRGCGRSSYQLLPTLYRHPTKRSIQDIATLEKQLMMRFRQRSIPLLNRELKDDWDTLFFMQHYGVPTRLLDWTENPFIGFYFAVMSAPFRVKATSRGRGQIRFQADAAVWVLDPVAWNSHALRHQKFDRGVLSPADEALQGYRPLTKFADMNNHPVALYGAHNSPRIVAQRGVFTIFGQGTGSMQRAYIVDSFPAGALTKIILTRGKLPQMRGSILSHGITEGVVFPDLEGLAREIKRDFNFED